MAQPVIEVAAFGVQASAPSLAARAGVLYPDYGSRPVSTRVFYQDSWRNILQRLQVTTPAALDAAYLAEFPDLVPAKYVRVREDSRPDDARLDYVLSAQEAYSIRMLQAGAEIRHGPPSPDLLRAMREDDTKTSLFTATDAAGLPEAIALQLAEIFANEVDFHHDLSGGYRCAIVFEMYYPDGMPTPGLILAAEFVSPSKQLRAYFHDDGDGEAGYFDLDGIDVNGTLRPAAPGEANTSHAEPDFSKAFRRSPLEFSRVTSAPAALRYHPILKEWRAHRGTDYGAPIGTKILATGDGVVSFLGEKGSYGKLITLRHYDRFTSKYGHLHAFAAKLRKGDSVRKGQVIGYVGMSGLATGPHLHYEFHADPGAAPTPVPLVVRRVASSQRAGFLARTSEYQDKLRFARSFSLVLLE
jgi:murein DD-endopeptidase MepM/ murein hydrolase activator NlpD